MKKPRIFPTNTRFGLAIWAILSSVLCTAFVGGIGFFIIKKVYVFSYIFWLCFASPWVSALLLLLTDIPEDLTFGFGAALYYGTLVVAHFTEKAGWVMKDLDRYFVGFIISALICYIVYLRRFKNE